MTKPKSLTELVVWARTFEMTPEDRQEQLVSLAYGNIKLHNPPVTKEMVEKIVMEGLKGGK